MCSCEGGQRPIEELSCLFVELTPTRARCGVPDEDGILARGGGTFRRTRSIVLESQLRVRGDEWW